MLVVLLLRVMVPIITTPRYNNQASIKVTGEVTYTYQNKTKCITYIKDFYFENERKCQFSQGDKIRLVGKYNKRLIDIIRGEFYLSDAKIDVAGVGSTKVEKQYVKANPLIGLREKIEEIYYRNLPAKEAGLVAGIVLGSKTGIGADLYQKMINSGTIHIAVASGYNLMLVGGSVLSWSLYLLKRHKATLITIVIMLIYAVMAGFEPPVVRAWVMASMVFVGQAIGRRQTSVWALWLTIWMMLVIDPGLAENVSFWLSVMASVGLMIVEPFVLRRIDTQRYVLIGLFSKLGILTTLCTLMTTAPVIWISFGRVSLISLVSNTLVLPLVPIVMVLGAMMILGGSLLAIPTYAVTHLIVLIISWLG